MGLGQAWMDEADLKVRIPMLGQVDSLNVANATTILLYEAVRQRRTQGRAPAPRASACLTFSSTINWSSGASMSWRQQARPARR